MLVGLVQKDGIKSKRRINPKNISKYDQDYDILLIPKNQGLIVNVGFKK